MPFGAAIAAVGAIGGAAISASGSRDAARSARRNSVARDATGEIAGLGFQQITSDNRIVSDANQFTDLSQAFGAQAQNQLGIAGADAFDVDAATGGIEGLQQNRLATQNQFGALGNAINGVDTFDVDGFAAEQFDRLNSLSARGEETAANSLATNLFSRGRLGRTDTTTGDAFSALDRSQEEARTSRALQAIGLAGTERDRLFGEQQQNIQNQFGFLNSLTGNQQQGVAQFGNLFGLNQATQQQGLNNAQALGANAGQVLQPNFNALTLLQNIRSSDQASRAGVASTAAGFQNQAAQTAGNAFANIGAGIGNAVFEARNN